MSAPSPPMGPRGSTSQVPPSPVLARVDAKASALWDSTNWDLDTQQPHGGQEWASLQNFVEDFSVTTNVLGPPWRAVAACAAALQHIDHYPAANFEPAHTELADWLIDDPCAVTLMSVEEKLAHEKKVQSLHKRLMLGNGASELIDLVTRAGAHPGPLYVKSAQYKEYERAALAHGREKVESEQHAAIMAVVNPCNPTGEYRTVEEMKTYITEACSEGTTVLIDESMQLWHGPKWREDSLSSQPDWVRQMAVEKDIKIFIIHSWTKIWSCPGIRLGSIIAPLAEDVVQLKQHQVPWSLNICALAFLSSALADKEFMEHTWSVTRSWRDRTIEKLQVLHPTWTVHGEKWLSWLWVDTKSEGDAKRSVVNAKAAGCPVRDGGVGYNMPTFIRLAVRAPDKQDVLFRALTW